MSFKAVLLNRGIDFPFTHNLAKLMELLEAHGESIPSEIKKADRLTRFAVETRYPGADPVPKSVYDGAIAIAEAVVGWAEAQVGWNNPDPN